MPDLEITGTGDYCGLIGSPQNSCLYLSPSITKWPFFGSGVFCDDMSSDRSSGGISDIMKQRTLGTNEVAQ